MILADQLVQIFQERYADVLAHDCTCSNPRPCSCAWDAFVSDVHNALAAAS